MNYYGNNKQKNKFSNLFIMMIGFVIGASVLLITNAQEPTITIPTGSYQSISDNGGIEDTEKGITGEYSSGGTTVELTKSETKGDSGKNKGAEKVIERPIQPILRTGDKKVLVRGFPEDSMATKIVTYAYKISNGDMDFLKMLRCENGGFDINTRGDKGLAVGLCQMHIGYHKLPEQYYNDWMFQLEYCYNKYKGGTKFYGPDRIIEGQRCSSYVEKDFYFE